MIKHTLKEMPTHKASGVSLYQPLLLPDATKWNDVFYDQAPWDFKGDNFLSVMGKTGNEFGSYCARRDGDSMTIKACPEVIKKLDAQMLVIRADRKYFEAIDHGNGWTLICCLYNQILGSVYVAYVRTDSIPKV